MLFVILVVVAFISHSTTQAADIDLADAPLFTTITPPGNLALALSVEWPTANTAAYSSAASKLYASTNRYIGYFDSDKCYRYVYNSTDPKQSFFQPYSATTTRTCTSNGSTPLWSGNFLNWSSMQAMDVFRSVLTGGYRSVDGIGNTILTKIFAQTPSNLGINITAPDKTITTGISGATPFSWSTITTGIQNQGISMLVTSTATEVSTERSIPTTGCQGKDKDPNGHVCLSSLSPIDYVDHNSYVDPADAARYAEASKIYRLYINVQVCDGTKGLEKNCSDYTQSGSNNYKPEGLMQKYSTKIRFATFGYLNDTSDPNRRDGGVLRSPMKFIGPLKTDISGGTLVNDSPPEWSSTTGVFDANPEISLSSTLGVANSGTLNYINKFGSFRPDEFRYRRNDPVSELYYTVTRYYRNIGNVPDYVRFNNSTDQTYFIDGFPIVREWNTTPWTNGKLGSQLDPIIYSCQKNFILGIGDVYANNDTNLPGSALRNNSTNEPATPSEVVADESFINVVTSTKMIANLEGVSEAIATSYAPTNCPPSPPGQALCPNRGTNNSFYIAGLAYHSHTTDIRPDIPDTPTQQTISTYWLDVKEDDVYVSRNQYWMAAKYGGFTVPSGFNPYGTDNNSSTLTLADWYSTTDTLEWTDAGGNRFTDLRPDNYFLADQGDSMAKSLEAAFAKIASELGSATTTAFSAATRKSTATTNANYSASYDASNWVGKVVGSRISYAEDMTPTLTEIWDARSILESTSHDSRKIITCCKVSTDATGSSRDAGLPFTLSSLTSNTLISRTNVSTFGAVSGAAAQSVPNYISYLRGDRTQEINKGGVYRNRKYLLGDIVNSKPTAIAAPTRPYYDSYNPGYGAFKKRWANRGTVVYVGANDGMLHAFDGSLASATRGRELFAYIPSFIYGSAATASSTGLASLGNPNFTHKYLVDAPPLAFDADLANTYGSTTSTPDWRTIIIGGLGKGGKGYYAIDVTDPSSWTSEEAVASKVLWEFTDSRMGYSYGDAHVVKTAKYGWVVLLTSGYNNSDGKGYLFVVNPKTGALIEAISTPTSATTPVNFSQMRAFIPNVTDYTVESIYIGDLQGNIWRFNLTQTSDGNYPAPTLIAQLKNESGESLPITTAPMIGIDPSTLKRYIMVGTGRLLHQEDIDNNLRQSFFSIVDGTSRTNGFYTQSTLPSDYSFPITRNQLTKIESFQTGLDTVSATPSPMGWYYDVEGGITTDGDVYNGIVAFGVNIPNLSVCSPSGTSVYYAVRFASGVSALVDSSGEPMESASNEGGIVTEISVQSVNGTILVTAGDSSGKVTTLRVGSIAGITQRLNWREISTID